MATSIDCFGMTRPSVMVTWTRDSVPLKLREPYETDTESEVFWLVLVTT